MINAEASFNGRTSTLVMSGHAGFAARGQDIVCAGASALCGALYAHIEELELCGHITVGKLTMKEGSFACTVDDVDGSYGKEAVKIVCDGLGVIAEKYPDRLRLTTNAY